MTLGDFFNYLSQHPSMVLFYFLALPITAALALVFGRGEGHISPWKYLYSALIYLSAIPGIFAITLNVYLFLFERQSIMQANIFTQILPVLIMLVTFFLVRRNVDFEQIPGFGKISGLICIITALIVLMWILEKTHIIAITFLPFHIVLIIFAVLLIAVVFGWRRLMGGS